MDADAVARLEPGMAQAGDQVVYKGEGLGMAEGDAGSGGRCEDLSGGMRATLSLQDARI
jgi:hypothetical protein